MSTRQLAAEDGNYGKEDAVITTTLDNAEVDLNMQNTFREDATNATNAIQHMYALFNAGAFRWSSKNKVSNWKPAL